MAPKPLRIRTNKGERGVRGLLHDVAELPGELEIALSRKRGRFDHQRLPANARPCKPRDHADLRFGLDLVAAMALRPQPIRDALSC